MLKLRAYTYTVDGVLEVSYTPETMPKEIIDDPKIVIAKNLLCSNVKDVNGVEIFEGDIVIDNQSDEFMVVRDQASLVGVSTVCPSAIAINSNMVNTFGLKITGHIYNRTTDI